MPRVVPPPDLESSLLLLLLYNSIQFDRKSLTSPFSKDKKRGVFFIFREREEKLVVWVQEQEYIKVNGKMRSL